MRRCSRSTERCGALFLIFALAALMGCKRSEPDQSAAPARVPDGTPVVLISIDTLRADRLPIYGYSQGATPSIDALRSDAILFERAYTHIGLTLPSHSSIFSGLLPQDHGVRDNIGYRFAPDLPTLPALMKRQDYATGAFVSAYVLRSDTGLARGFDVYDDDVAFEAGKQLGALQRSGPETLGSAKEWLRQVYRGPFFLFFHIYEPHAPYEPPVQFAAGHSAAYDGEVAAADAVIGGLLSELKQLGVYDDALIVLLSDHGEGLMDHGEMDHLVLIYREVLQVPLLLKLPGGQGAGTTVSAPAQLTDVAATLLSLLGFELDPRLAGVSLLGLENEENANRHILSESVYPRIHFGWSDLASIIDGEFHFIDGPDPELYNLREDPGEKQNILLDQRAEARRLRTEIESYNRTLQSPAEVDPETRESLQALGYLSGGAQVKEGPLSDPKSRIHVITDLGRAAILSREGKNKEAAEVFVEVLKEEPEMPFAWQQLGATLQKEGDRQGALEAMIRALELSEGRSDIAASVAELYFEVGDLEQARTHAELALPISPKAHEVLANVALREGELDEAEKHNEQALTHRGKRVQPLITQSALLNRRGLHQQALAVCEQAELEFGDRSDSKALHGLFFQRGTAYGSLGHFAEAKQAYRRSIELGPHNLEAYAALAFLHALENDGPEAGRVLEEMVTENPTPAAYAEAVKTLRAMEDDEMAQTVLGYAQRRWPDSEALKRL